MKRRSLLVALAALLSVACGRTSLLGGSEPGSGGSSALPMGGAGSGGSEGGTATAGATTMGGQASAGTSSTGGAPMSEPLVFLPATLPRARVRWDYSASLAARGGAGAPFAFRLLKGALPTDVTLTAEGRMSGIPTRIGEYPLTIEATDRAGASATRDYVLTVEPPRFLAHVTFLSSSSTRTSLRLTDITSLKTHTVLEDGGSYNAFSFDGKWLAFCQHRAQGNGEVSFVDTTGTEPGPQQPLLDPGQLVPCGTWVWSPDSHRIAYDNADALWVAELDAAGGVKHTKLLDGVMPLGFSWPRSDLLFARDAQGRANALRLQADGSVQRTIIDVPDSTLLSASMGGELAFGYDATGAYLLVDTKAGTAEPLGAGPIWDASPGLALLVSRSNTGEFSLFTHEGTTPQALRSGTNANGPRFGVFAGDRAFVQQENGRAVVTELAQGRAVARVVGGTYSQPHVDAFDSTGTVLAFADRDAIWLSDLSGQGALSARLASNFGQSATNMGPGLAIGRSTRKLIAWGGTPYAARLVDFGNLDQPLVSQVGVQLDWSESVWSPDDVRVTILGASTQLGRVLYLVDPAHPLEARVVTQCQSYGGSEPLCPNVVRFQP